MRWGMGGVGTSLVSVSLVTLDTTLTFFNSITIVSLIA